MAVRKHTKHLSSTSSNEEDLVKMASGKVLKRNSKLSKMQSNGRRYNSYRIGVRTVFALIFATIIVILVYWRGSNLQSRTNLPRAITPLSARRFSELKQFRGQHRERLFWGTYRPHLYLGIRSRSPQSLLSGLMWLGIKNGQYALRHTCEESDKLAKYGWVRHDGSTYGHQEIIDQQLSISTTFLKNWGQGSGYGGDWAVRIKAEKPHNLSEDRSGAKERVSSFLFYVVDETGRALTLSPQQTARESAPFVAGFHPDIGEWEMHFKMNKPASVNYLGLRQFHMHNLTKSVENALELQARTTGHLNLPDTSDQRANMVIFQVTTAEVLELDVIFVSGVRGWNAQVQNRVQNLSGISLSKKIVEKEGEFEDHFQKVFQLQDKVDSAEKIEVGRAALSNLIGGIGYFYGESQIAIPPKLQDKSSKGPDHWLYWPDELYTAVPSRSFFPRGFLWDEGFHQLVISRWDHNISLDIIGHWLDLMNADGWIPREQILGAEARSKVPQEFIMQHTSNANPPALFLVLHDLAINYKSAQESGEATAEDKEFFETAFTRLKAWFNWFNTTQAGILPGSYYWHGRDFLTNMELNPKTLTSGLDDYPRASHPSNDERHVDLLCWMAHSAKAMVLIAQIAGQPHEIYEATARRLSNITLLNELHFDDDTARYSDFGSHTEKVKLRWKEIQDPRTGYVHKILRRSVLDHPQLRWIPHFGYVSLFPLLMRIIPHDSPILGAQLEMLHSHKLLWTDVGLRSLATTSSLYMKHNTEHDAPYWRGPVWININYLVLSALHHYSKVTGPYQRTSQLVYSQLRSNIIRNIVSQYQESGYLWENYDSIPKAKGKGRGSHPFTGWTSLVVLIMAEIY